MRKYIDFEERIENILNDIRVEIIELIESTGKKEYTFKRDYLRLTLTDEFDNETIVVSKIKWDDETGEILQSASRDREEILLQTYDLDQIRNNRLSWGLFRDRRPEYYGEIVK